MSFVYHANALAFGGVIRNPCCDVLPSTASVVLSPSGGEGSETIRNFNYKGIISFDEASVYVGGSERGDYRNTISTVSIRNLNILNMVHVELLVGRVTSEHHFDPKKPCDPENPDCEEPQFTFEGSLLENIRVAGKRVDVKLDHSVFSRYPTHTAFVDAFNGPAAEEDKLLGNTAAAAAAKGKLVDRYAKRFCWPADRCGKGAPASKDNVIRCSLVDAIDVPDTDENLHDEKTRRDGDRIHPVRRNGYIVRIADFGTVAIGEVVLKPHQRTVNMLRFVLGSPTDGEFTAGSGTTNGTDIYP
jgi:hypothetical protein